jgi:hypothetical protein
MDRITIGLTSIFLVLTIEAHGQNITSRATGAVNGVGSAAGAATAGVLGQSGSPGSNLSAPANGPGNGSAVGGNLPGALGIKAGDKVIEFRGSGGVGDDRGNFKAGLGIPF